MIKIPPVRLAMFFHVLGSDPVGHTLVAERGNEPVEQCSRIVLANCGSDRFIRSYLVDQIRFTGQATYPMNDCARVDEAWAPPFYSRMAVADY